MAEEGNKKEKQRANKKRKPGKKVNIKLVALSLLVLLTVCAVALVAFMGVVLAQNYSIDESLLEMNEVSRIYDRNGEEIDRLYLENREYLSLDEIPDLLKETFVAVEDQRFYDHHGVDFRAIGRALYRNIMARGIVEGGSTITQQLAKNVFLTHEQTWMRKSEEPLIAINLERRYSKEEILEMYLNYIFFGHNAYGIQAASKIYFDKEDLNELEVGEIAMLAALPKGPSIYSPLQEKNEERSENRRQVVLQVMEEQGLITADERAEAANTPLELNTEGGATQNPALLTYVDMLIEEAEEEYGITQDQLMTGGYQIYTALDMNAQQIMYDALHVDRAQDLFPEAGPEAIVQGSMVIMDPYNGAVTAVMGGRDYVRTGTNRATSEARQPGSSFKPIAVYAPALEEGWGPYDMVRDEQITYPGDYTPRNYNRQYHGSVTMLRALEQSYNAAAVWLLNEIGIDQSLDYVRSFGFETEKRELGLALGDIGASPLGMAAAFSTFANDGLMMEPYLIERIVDRDGQTLAEHQAEYSQVVSAQTAWYMTEMMESVVGRGTGTNAGFNHPVAGKTGTVQEEEGQEGVRDAWFVGYTPYYTAAVWMGFDRSDPDHVMNTTGGNHPARLFQHVMEQVHADLQVRAFERPSSADELEPPVQMERIDDLRAHLTLHSDLSLSVDLEFTPTNDDRIQYRIYRSGGSGGRTLIGETQGGSWSDRDIQVGGFYEYEVVPLNTLTNEEGSPSNRAGVEVSPEYPFFRRSDVDEEDYERWLEVEFGIPREEEEEEEEEMEEEEPEEDEEEEIEEEEPEEEEEEDEGEEPEPEEEPQEPEEEEPEEQDNEAPGNGEGNQDNDNADEDNGDED